MLVSKANFLFEGGQWHMTNVNLFWLVPMLVDCTQCTGLINSIFPHFNRYMYAVYFH